MDSPAYSTTVAISAIEGVALAEGRKTQFRRPLLRLKRFGAITDFGPSTTPSYDWSFRDRGMVWNDLRDRELFAALPLQVNDRFLIGARILDEARVTAVRVQRLQDISEEDAVAEGALRGGPGGPVAAYRAIWDEVLAVGRPRLAWEVNPWVVATSFLQVMM